MGFTWIVFDPGDSRSSYLANQFLSSLCRKWQELNWETRRILEWTGLLEYQQYFFRSKRRCDAPLDLLLQIVIGMKSTPANWVWQFPILLYIVNNRWMSIGVSCQQTSSGVVEGKAAFPNNSNNTGIAWSSVVGRCPRRKCEQTESKLNCRYVYNTCWLARFRFIPTFN